MPTLKKIATPKWHGNGCGTSGATYLFGEFIIEPRGNRWFVVAAGGKVVARCNYLKDAREEAAARSGS